MAKKTKKKRPSKQAPANQKTRSKGKKTTKPKRQAKRAATRAAKTATRAKGPPNPARKSTRPSKAGRGNAGGAKAKRTTLLDAAARVLKESRKAMRSGEIVEVILKKGYWQSSGKTPHATLHAAMIREIKDKGQESRFKKVDRGLFDVQSKS